MAKRKQKGSRGRGSGSQSAMPGRQKGMARMAKMMGEGGPMGMMAGMCQDMLGAIRQTNALAVFATPELQHAFAEWLQELEEKAESALAEGEKDAAALAGALKISEETARYLLARLAASGKATLIARLPRNSGAGRTP